MDILYVSRSGQKKRTGALRYRDLIFEFATYNYNVIDPTAPLNRRFNCDVIHVLDIKEVSPVTIKVLKVYNRPIIVDVHDYSFVRYHYVPSVDAPIRYFLYLKRHRTYRKIMAMADAIVVHSRYLQQLLNELGYKAIRIPIGIPIDRYAVSSKDWNEMGMDKMLFVGRDYFQKGIGIVLKALRYLKKEGHRLGLRVIGIEYPHAYLIARAMALGIDVEFSPETNDIIKEFKSASVFLRPSYLEGFGLAILEAMASRTPVIATRTGAIPELIGNDCGYLIDVGDAKALAMGIKAIFKDPEQTEEMVNRAFEKAKGYDVNIMINNLLKLYKEIV